MIGHPRGVHIEEMEVAAIVQYDKDHAFWLVDPYWSTRKDLDAVP